MVRTASAVYLVRQQVSLRDGLDQSDRKFFVNNKNNGFAQKDESQPEILYVSNVHSSSETNEVVLFRNAGSGAHGNYLVGRTRALR